MIAGIDEAGRGPLAGPVVAAAVILNPDYIFQKKLTDSKKLTEKAREALFDDIISHALAYGIGQATVAEIDEMNILQATFLAMRRAVGGLAIAPKEVWVDGNQDPRCGYPTKTVVQGDLLVPEISAASILAKVTRDRLMCEMDVVYPGYGFAKHKGYGTQMHLSAIASLGVTSYHRHSFAPVKKFATIAV